METATVSLPVPLDHVDHYVVHVFDRVGRGVLDLDEDSGIGVRYRRLLGDHVYRRSGFRCVYCGLDFLRDLDTLWLASHDHLVPRLRGGLSSPGNVVACCLACNSLKASRPYRTLNGARQALALLRQRHVRWFDLLREAYR